MLIDRDSVSIGAGINGALSISAVLNLGTAVGRKKAVSRLKDGLVGFRDRGARDGASLLHHV